MKKIQIKYLTLFAIPHACVLIFCLGMIIAKAATPFVSSFDIDSKGRVYVCENEGICIYQDRVKIGAIALAGETYFVDIDENDSIRVIYTSRVDWMDSNGNNLKTVEDPGAYTEFNSKRYRPVAVKDDTYKMIGHYGWTRIVKNNSEVVYRQSVLSFGVKMLLQVCTVSMFVSFIWMMIRLEKMKATGS